MIAYTADSNNLKIFLLIIFIRIIDIFCQNTYILRKTITPVFIDFLIYECIEK